ncbi:MAG: OPT family oligopeptide transporter [Phycisphaerales bacterium]|nr:MAG: OPT family oligopeptide transporter [Phycisphaerales bacterium]
MAILQLSEEQINTLSVEEKDRWWLENVYRGNMPQLTLRSALTGMILGGVLSLTNLYVGMKTGWSLGVGITSVILAYAIFRGMSWLGLASEFTVLENNCMQSIATAAGYMTAPLIASLAAYMLITNEVVEMVPTALWMISISLLGVLCAFPLKRRFINDEQHPFPEGRAAGVVMDALHSGEAAEGLFKAKILIVGGVLAALVKFLAEGGEYLKKFHLEALEIPHRLEEWFLNLTGWAPALGGSKLHHLNVYVEPDHVMFAAGGLMGIRTGVSLLAGALVNYLLIAPMIVQYGDIYGVVGGDGELDFGFRRITTWALWGGVAMMTVASLFSFLSKPKMLIQAFAGLLSPRKAGSDVLKHVELPMWVFLIGIPVVGLAVVELAHHYFDVVRWQGWLAIPLVFVFSIIAAHSTALTAITPTGALGKITQLTFAAITPSIKTNIITASIMGEVAGNSSNLLMDIKPGYMLGGKPRHQAMGHVLGIFAGALACVPVFHFAFLRGNPAGLLSEQFPFPAAITWKAVAEILTRGLGELPPSAVTAVIIGACMGLLVEILKLVTKNRFPISAVGFSLAFVITFPTCLAMSSGAIFFWVMAKLCRSEESLLHRIFVKNLEPVCAGVIAGGAIMGIFLAVLTVVLGLIGS